MLLLTQTDVKVKSNFVVPNLIFHTPVHLKATTHSIRSSFLTTRGHPASTEYQCSCTSLVHKCVASVPHALSINRWITNGFKKDGGRVCHNNCTLLLVWLTGFLGTILGAACLDFFKASTVGGFTWVGCLGLSCFDRKKVTRLPKTNLASLTLKMDGWNTFLSFLGQKAHFQSVYLLFVLGGVTSGPLIFWTSSFLKLVVSTLWNLFATTTQLSFLMLNKRMPS